MAAAVGANLPVAPAPALNSGAPLSPLARQAAAAAAAAGPAAGAGAAELARLRPLRLAGLDEAAQATGDSGGDGGGVEGPYAAGDRLSPAMRSLGGSAEAAAVWITAAARRNCERGGKPYVAYTLEVWRGEERRWVAIRRYSEFERLRAALVASRVVSKSGGGTDQGLPALPKTRGLLSFGTPLSDQEVGRRRDGLEVFLREMIRAVQPPERSAALMQFLGPPKVGTPHRKQAAAGWVAAVAPPGASGALTPGDSSATAPGEPEPEPEPEPEGREPEPELKIGDAPGARMAAGSAVVGVPCLLSRDGRGWLLLAAAMVALLGLLVLQASDPWGPTALRAEQPAAAGRAEL